MNILQQLAHFGACDDAVFWVSQYPEDIDPKTLWDECPRGDWLMWMVERLSINYKLAVRAGSKCIWYALADVATITKSGVDTRLINSLRQSEAWAEDRDPPPDLICEIEALRYRPPKLSGALSNAIRRLEAITIAAEGDHGLDSIGGFDSIPLAASLHMSLTATTRARYDRMRADSLKMMAAIIRDNIPWIEVFDGLNVNALRTRKPLLKCPK